VLTVWVDGHPLEGIEAVLFDKDGTLADTSGFLRLLAQARVKAIQSRIPEVDDRLLLAMGASADRWNSAGLMAVGTREQNGVAAAAYVAETGCSWSTALALVQQAFAEADRICGDKALQTWPYEDTEFCLERLAQSGLDLGILTGDTLGHTQAFLERYDLGQWIQVIGAADTGPAKPDPASVWRLCEQLGIAPDRVLLVGDSAIDMQAAKAAGLAAAIGIDRTYALPNTIVSRTIPPKAIDVQEMRSQALSELQADFLIQSLDALQVSIA
jgi:phosphoglycolate phosphatase